MNVNVHATRLDLEKAVLVSSFPTSHIQRNGDERTTGVLRREHDVQRLLELRTVHASPIDEQMEDLLSILKELLLMYSLPTLSARFALE